MVTGPTIKLDVNEDGSQYLTVDGYQPFIEHKETIMVGDQAKTVTVKDTIWGPVIIEKENKPLLAYRWVAHDPQG